MIKQLLAASGAVCISLLPAQARIESGTGDLLRLINTYGVTVSEGSNANCNGSMGQIAFKPGDVSVDICFSGTPTAKDHDTVRHEAWHLLQYCSAVERGVRTRALPPYITDRNEYIQFVQTNLSNASIERIKRIYPSHHHGAELEAFAAAKAYTANQISSLMRKTCTPVFGTPTTASV